MMDQAKNHTGSLQKYSFLVTGGAGFIGSHIVEYLLSHDAKHVRVMDNLSTGFAENTELFITNPAYEFQHADICDPDTCLRACSGMDFVFHQAALGSVPRSIKDPLAAHQTNVTGFLNILEAAKTHHVRRVVFASSSSVFGDSPALPKSEEQLGNPLSPYAVTKRTDELYAQVYAKVYGMEIIGLRYFNIFGPRQSPEGPYAAAIPLFIDALLSHKPVKIYGNGEQSRDFTFVANAVQANILAIFAENPSVMGEIFNIAAGNQMTVNRLYSILKDYAGTEAMVRHEPERRGDILHSFADITKAQKMLGYRPRVSAEEGLKITFEWFRNRCGQ